MSTLETRENLGTTGGREDSRPANRSSVFVARQPIFDREKNVHGYELLFRSGLENYCMSGDGDESTLDVIANSFLVIGLDELTDGRRGFINFTRNLLVRDVASLLPPDGVTVEILEDVEPDAETLEACRKLKEAGYTLAMDDFVAKHMDSPFCTVKDMIEAYELGQWEQFAKHAAELKIDEADIPALYQDSWNWAKDAFGQT